MQRRGHRDLVAWQKALMLVTEIYRVARTFPKDEMYGPVSQLRRAAVSVPSNLAEGQGRNSPNEFHHFIGQARGRSPKLRPRSKSQATWAI